MIESYAITSSSVKKTEIGSKERSTKVVYSYNTTKSDIDQIKSEYKLESYDIKNALDPDERPRLDERTDYTLLLFRSTIDNKEKDITTFGIFVMKNDIIVISKYDIKEITLLMHKLPEREFKHDTQSMVLEILNAVTDSYYNILDKIDDSMEDIQESIIKSPDTRDLEDIFFYKRKLVYIHKALMSNREVVSTIEKGYSRHIKGSQKTRALYNSLIELVDMEEIYRDIATSVVELHASAISNNLNKVMKTLTILATIILVPTLISGIYGMNISLPLQENPRAFAIIMGWMVVAMFLIFMWFKREKWA